MHLLRLKTEILIQMDSIAAEGVFFIGATNCPWDLDTAFLRRFQKKIYIEAPDK
jgi:vacuolar protein-sorting-associated protein 4